MTKKAKRLALAALAGVGGLLFFLKKSEGAPKPGEDDDPPPGTPPTSGRHASSGDIAPGVAQGARQGATETYIPGTSPKYRGDLHSDVPRAGNFYQVGSGDTLLGEDGLVAQVLRDAGLRAAREVGGLDGAAAEEFARNTVKGSNRVTYHDATVCSGWNDLHYGTWGYSSRKNRAGPHGRSIRMLPIHADNRARIEAHQAPIRNVQMRGPEDAGKGNGRAIDNALAEKHEYLFFPDINLDILWETGEITSRGLEWEDGTSRSNPPPGVMALGSATEPTLAVYGCGVGELGV